MEGLLTTSKGFASACLLFISLLGLCLAAILTFNGAISGTGYPWRKPLIGSIFSAICVSGILSALFPSKCSHMFNLETGNVEKTSNEAGYANLWRKSPRLQGHHPSCGNFSAHVFLIGDRTLCAGCVGLALGGMASLLGTFLYFFADLSPTEGYLFVFWAGFVGVACGLLQHRLFKFKRSFIHMVLNGVFVLGAFMLLVGADAMTNSFSITIYILALDIFWIYTRIELSRWNHETICHDCKETCSYYPRRSS